MPDEGVPDALGKGRGGGLPGALLGRGIVVADSNDDLDPSPCNALSASFDKTTDPPVLLLVLLRALPSSESLEPLVGGVPRSRLVVRLLAPAGEPV